MSSSDSRAQGQYPDSWPLTPDQKAIVHVSERLNFQRPDDLATNPIIPDDAVRSEALKLFDRLEGVKTPEQIELINRIADQYDSSVATWTTLDISTEGIPTKTEVTAWLNSLPAKTLENLAAYGEVRLKFIPPVKAWRLVRKINGYSWPDWDSVQTGEWEFGLTTDMQDMLHHDPEIYSGDKLDGTTPMHEFLIHLYEEKYKKEGLDLMPPEAYAPSAIDALAQGKVLDLTFYTVFKPKKAGRSLLCAKFENGIVELKSNAQEYPFSMLRTRPWLKGKVLD